MSTPAVAQQLPSYTFKGNYETFMLLLGLLAELPYKVAKPAIDDMQAQLQQQEIDAADASNAAAAQHEQELSDQLQTAASQQQAAKDVSTDNPNGGNTSPPVLDTLTQN